MRIVSLLASGTEIICELGGGQELVGRSHECDNPDWVRTLPACTSPAFDVEGSSRAIDLEVRRRLRERLPLYHIDGDLITRLNPDLLITQEHCEVCAVTPANIAEANCAGLAKEVLALSAGTVNGIYDGMRAIGRAIRRTDAAERLVETTQRRIGAIFDAVQHRPTPGVVVVEWSDPIFPASNWIPELIEAANGKLLLGQKGEHSGATGWEQVRETNPDFLVIAPCGYNLKRSLQEIPVMEGLPGWFELRCVKEGRVVFADGNKLL